MLLLNIWKMGRSPVWVRIYLQILKGLRWATSMLPDEAFSDRGKSGNVLGFCSGFTKRNRK